MICHQFLSKLIVQSESYSADQIHDGRTINQIGRRINDK